MSRIKSKFQDLRSKHQKALIAYIMAGFPSERDTISAVRGLAKGGADIIELGMPFSDPLADGPVIQNAGFQALQKGMNLDKFLLLVKKIRMETDLPLILMTYTNILYRHGYDKFISTVKKAGIDGLILPDMSIDESKDFLQAAKKNNMDSIFLISPNTAPGRIKKISDSSSGFLYLVSVFGTTGGQQQFQNYTTHAIKNTKKILGGKIPLGVGFGVSNPDQARFIIKSGADAIIVGSAFLRLMESTPSEKIESKIGQFTSSLKKATITE
ncbi:tryptophan synthase subunit alpha [Candidatus Nitrosotalea okcheonensis]|uniref:Tryptophan synthase alpha chain n=1 Tax=Candidatus Nitrosotalea okcheonensis TaxID=1903276 RepID=A0A2H1FD63_9ARCH|nr:tryptophan synthase subunit alpha [Candidatus Nitrosotalea okcheonensis]MDE1728491.1 tryptophan synthase subunit alpha [Nitrososphaerota archaeon]MDE1832264.1 tryptophan synthase subunit alpha [Nitrososphaerota archaeon]MDE1877373.1 tryptophan synthase subunit alpha [Nitrososphaerota archaeon]SMH70691.1 Tryptophan synthase alpha chain [Candidatus Nitrosotalea okcheonensis]